jgi:type VI secretion system protein ImpB
MAKSMQDDVGKQRPPRVHIRYDVETGGAMPKTELPFVVGVMADLSGDANANLPGLDDRKFDDINKDNFNEILKAAAPEVSMRVANTLANDGSQLGVTLKFNSMDDFSPAAVAKQIEPLKQLLEERQKLQSLLAKMSSQRVSEDEIAKIIENTETRQKLLQEVGGAGQPEAKKGD